MVPPAAVVDCGKHGAGPWRGHIACGRCGALYQTDEPTEARYAPPVCLCGVPLIPLPGVVRCEAIPFCGACFGDRVASGFR